MILVTLGTGVGGGIIGEGRRLLPDTMEGGEIGHANICHEEQKAVTVEIRAALNSTHLLQELSVWLKKPLLLPMKRAF